MWHSRAIHCPLCGQDLKRVDVGGRRRPRCVACGFVLYANPASAAAAVVVDPGRRVLLVKRAIEPFRGHWALPAGYQELDEPPAETAIRETWEEAGVRVEVRGLLDLVFVPDDPRKPANVAFFLCVPVGAGSGAPSGGAPRPGGEEEAADWFALDQLPSPIGFGNYERILGRLASLDQYSDAPWPPSWGPFQDPA